MTERVVRALAFCAVEGLDVTVSSAGGDRTDLLAAAAREVERICAERGIDPHDALQRLGTSAE